MSLSITQVPAQLNPAQSPIIFTLSESGGVIDSSSFQYVADLYYWTGNIYNSGSVPQYTLVKYPNNSNVGIFDVSRIVNSSLTASAQQDSSNIKYIAADFYTQWQSGSVYVTGSHTKSLRYKALDGYSIFQEPIGQMIASKSLYWPLMSNGPATQSYFTNDYGNMSVYTGFYGLLSDSVCDNVRYTGSLGNYKLLVSGTLDTQYQTQYVPIGPAQTGFPLSTASDWFTIQPYSGSYSLGAPIRFELNCQQKYPNIRIKWKNRFGQFDYFNFYMVSKTSFKSEKRTYEPQLGSWQGSNLSYQNYDSAMLNYLVDSNEKLIVNTFWISEDYNNILKQLMVSDEIYWLYGEGKTDVRPLTIQTDTIDFKTNVVDKLIQYSFEFNYGQPYKLIL